MLGGITVTAISKFPANERQTSQEECVSHHWCKSSMTIIGSNENSRVGELELSSYTHACFQVWSSDILEALTAQKENYSFT